MVYLATANGNAGGGYADRLRGIVSLYQTSKIFHFGFKIDFTHPFKLDDFLLPNQYDWRIAPNEIDRKAPATIDFHQWLDEIAADPQSGDRYQYILVSDNFNFAELRYGEAFDELFSPVAELRDLVDFHRRQIGGDFISATFRFMNLLGDFPGEYLAPLPPPEREQLLTRCLEHLAEIHRENPGKKVLVTADSVSFLAAAQKNDYVYAVCQKIVHPSAAQAAESGKEVWLKSFLDYFLLTYSQKVYLVMDGQMYNSGFPYRASLHRRAPYIVRRYCPDSRVLKFEKSKW